MEQDNKRLSIDVLKKLEELDCNLNHLFLDPQQGLTPLCKKIALGALSHTKTTDEQLKTIIKIQRRMIFAMVIFSLLVTGIDLGIIKLVLER